MNSINCRSLLCWFAPVRGELVRKIKNKNVSNEVFNENFKLIINIISILIMMLGEGKDCWTVTMYEPKKYRSLWSVFGLLGDFCRHQVTIYFLGFRFGENVIVSKMVFLIVLFFFFFFLLQDKNMPPTKDVRITWLSSLLSAGATK